MVMVMMMMMIIIIIRGNYFSPSRLCRRSRSTAQRIENAKIAQTHLFYLLAFETMGPINVVELEFISDLGQRISRVTDDPQETFISVPCVPTHFNCHSAH